MTGSFLGTPVLAEVQATTLAEIERELSSFASRWDIPSYMVVAHISRGGNTFVPASLTNVESKFVESYQFNGWGVVDLIVEKALSTTLPFVFDLQKAGVATNEWSAAMIEFGLDRGVVVPFFGPKRQSLTLELHQPAIASLATPDLSSLVAEAVILLARIFPAIERILSVKVEYEEPLNAVEKEVLTLIAAGKPLKVISSTMGLSMKTISNHIQSICDKFKVATRDQALCLAVADNLITVVRPDQSDEALLLGF